MRVIGKRLKEKRKRQRSERDREAKQTDEPKLRSIKGEKSERDNGSRETVD